MEFNGKRALITGIQGFTGHYMAAELSAAGYRVFGLGSQPSTKSDYFQVDLLDAKRLNAIVEQVKPHLVVHLAAIAFIGHGDPAAFYNVNVVGTRNLLVALNTVADNIEAVLLASSANVYGNTQEGVLSEASAVNPANDYAVSKLAMEYMANLWTEKLPIIIARPFNYTGVGQSEDFLLPKIVSHFRHKASEIELGNLDVWRDFTDVRALVKAYLGLLIAKPIGETVNVCTGKTYSLREVIALCEAITLHNISIRVNPAFIRANEVKMLCGNASKLRSIVKGWNAPPLEKTLQWMLEDK
ncbi:GDP-mannose 4,6-dehydratase [Yersinia massiliensis]|uniref:GDP-mannose 4,6-dehydratase n=1 Tax=Yersinia massiliensis TaxID=419257 RepID=UPI0002E8F958|nr:GDP-mannose 4,6-dehydratase [Yersinia massiliensis]MCB5306749.1 GDP-mannose 4,6-dehydratase [Yersinia massiliensis]